jgi:hypothetical protein
MINKVPAIIGEKVYNRPPIWAKIGTKIKVLDSSKTFSEIPRYKEQPQKTKKYYHDILIL